MDLSGLQKQQPDLCPGAMSSMTLLGVKDALRHLSFLNLLPTDLTG